MKVLILNAESPSVFLYSSYYRRLGYEVFLGTSHRFPITLFSRFGGKHFFHPETGYLQNFGKDLLIDKGKVEKFVRILKNFIERKRIPKVIAPFENTLIPILLFYEDLKIEKIYPPISVVEKLHDKFLTFKTISKIKPKSFNLPQVYEGLLSYPCIIRPRKGMGSHLTFICRHKKEVKRAIEKLKTVRREPLIQQFINPEKKFFMNILVNRKGKVVRGVILQRIKKRKIKKVIKDLEKYFHCIGYFGFASPQFIVSNDNVYLVEINPRLSYIFFGFDLDIEFVGTFEKILHGKRVRKAFTFVKKLPSLLDSTYTYFLKTHDLIPSARAMLGFFKDKITMTLGKRT